MKSVALFALLVANTNALSGYWIPPLDTPGLDCEYKQIKVPGAGEFVCLELESSICRDNKGYFGKWWFGVGQPKPEDAGICDPETTYPIIYNPATKTYPITGTSIVDNDGNVCLDNNGEALTDCKCLLLCVPDIFRLFNDTYAACIISLSSSRQLRRNHSYLHRRKHRG